MKQLFLAVYFPCLYLHLKIQLLFLILFFRQVFIQDEKYISKIESMIIFKKMKSVGDFFSLHFNKLEFSFLCVWWFLSKYNNEDFIVHFISLSLLYRIISTAIKGFFGFNLECWNLIEISVFCVDFLHTI